MCNHGYDSLEDALKVTIEGTLDDYIKAQGDNLPKITTQQREEWESNIINTILWRINEDEEAYETGMPDLNPESIK